MVADDVWPTFLKNFSEVGVNESLDSFHSGDSGSPVQYRLHDGVGDPDFKMVIIILIIVIVIAIVISIVIAIVLDLVLVLVLVLFLVIIALMNQTMGLKFIYII